MSSLGQLWGGQEVCEPSPGQSSGATLSFSCLSGHLLSWHKEGKTGKKKDTCVRNVTVRERIG